MRDFSFGHERQPFVKSGRDGLSWHRSTFMDEKSAWGWGWGCLCTASIKNS